MTSNVEDRFRVVEPDDIERTPPYREGRRQGLTGDTGRQGPSGRRVLVVLVLSLTPFLLIWAASGMFHWW